MSPCILGIDPGLDGALAVVDTAGHILAIAKMPTWERTIRRSRKRFLDSGELAKLLKEWQTQFKLVSAAVERVGASPQMGSTSAFSFGHGYGIVQGVLAALGIKVVPVEPSVWKRTAGLGGQDKKASVTLATDKFAVTGKMTDGQAEAALIAWHVLQETWA